jgi:hypothetical protein
MGADMAMMKNSGGEVVEEDNGNGNGDGNSKDD